MLTLPDDDEWLARERRAIGDHIRVRRLRDGRTQESVFLAAGVRACSPCRPGTELGVLD
ncbi:hypothetical protein [Streptomyces lavenduligriseus]|uniref:Uncharacterized protein n=1 Tax=Streptomyces lavenduligriseus TaxID=67315 RepID=A0ABT0NUI2_9ACTN|nr:hypothetical protein [Streptomyces lavenduligriseus]MCL3994861.1 hypothetical protein [Streptomyces lavenduligriseus]